jgi:hypothetical protein
MASTDSFVLSNSDRVSNERGDRTHHSGAAGRGVKRTAPSPCRPALDPPPRQRARGPPSACDRHGGGGGGHPARRRFEQQAALGDTPTAMSEWLMPWERRPCWEYLPHLGEASADVQQAYACDAARREPSDVPADHGTAVRCDVVSAGSGQDNAGPTRGPSPCAQIAAIADDPRSRGDGIRGRDHPPGRAHLAGRGDDRADAAVAGIRGHGAVPGPSASSGISKAQEKLDMRNAALSRSLADHAERVARKDMGNIPRDATTARERIEALRRRVAQRQNAARAGDSPVSDEQLGGAPAAAAPGRSDCGDGRDAHQGTIEVRKIHQTHSVDGMHVNSGRSMSGGGGDAASGGGDTAPMADVGDQRDSATAAAASHVAWHTAAGGKGNLQQLVG